MDQPNSSSSSPLRVLIRPSSSSSSSKSINLGSLQPSASPPRRQQQKASPSTSSPPTDGVVVVGFIGSRPGADVSHLINRILDANVFGSGNIDKVLPVDLERKEGDWFRNRRISYHYVEEKGIVFLQFSSSELFSSGFGKTRDGIGGFELDLEEQEADDLRGFLFMFLVCHVIIFLHEGLRIETNVLKKFRMLQGAKNTMSPFIRSRITLGVPSKVSSSAPQAALPAVSSRSHVRVGSHHGSGVSLMSASAQNSLIAPGQWTPVMLFVFNGEFLDGLSLSSNVEEIPMSLLDKSSSSSGMSRSSMVPKVSSPVVMLARSTNKNEGNFKKKLQSSLDTQFRFLIKKCRILMGTESGGSRGGGNVTSIPLFSLDASRAVSLVDRSTNHQGQSLDLVTNLLDDAFNIEITSHASFLERHNPSSSIEDIQAIRDFIYRQSDSLRGKGGLLTNTSSGPTSGVGIVAAAAAAAAASAAAGKTLNPPKLLNLDNWVSTSNHILDILLSVRHQSVNETGHVSIKSVGISIKPIKDGKNSLIGSNSAEAVISCLESNRGLNMKFSMSWCKKALPSAKEVYLKDLPARYPTALHQSKLEKALQAFRRMVKGPAVPLFIKKLEDECTSIWESDRQLCDAVSLTGKPCIHGRQHINDCGSPSAEFKQHSSGHVFLHACACGRSRRFRDDPFDFNIANVSFNCFPNCEKFLPSFLLPTRSHTGPFSAFWSLVRLGGSRYYDPSKGLLQTGFCDSEKYLSKWIINLQKQEEKDAYSLSAEPVGCFTGSKFLSSAVNGKMKDVNALAAKEAPGTDKEHQKDLSDKISSAGSNYNSIGGIPPVRKKAFAEVVAGTGSMDLLFPPLQQKQNLKSGYKKDIKQLTSSSQSDNQVYDAHNHQTSDIVKNASAKEIQDKSFSVHDSSNGLGTNTNYGIEGEPFLQIGSYIVPVDSRNGRKSKHKHYRKQFDVHFGFEYECPHGHRFFISPEHLKELELHEQYMADSNGVFHEDLSTSGLRDEGRGFSLLNRNLPIYMKCPYCKSSVEKRKNTKFASNISQLQRIFMETPPFPIVVASCPVIQFEKSCLPASVQDHEHQSQFSLDCQVTLPPESFLALRLPFVYGIQVDDKSLQPLKHLDENPELTAWLVKGTALQVLSKDFNADDLNL